jgi:hypothetical protein
VTPAGTTTARSGTVSSRGAGPRFTGGPVAWGDGARGTPGELVDGADVVPGVGVTWCDGADAAGAAAGRVEAASAESAASAAAAATRRRAAAALGARRSTVASSLLGR